MKKGLFMSVHFCSNPMRTFLSNPMRTFLSLSGMLLCLLALSAAGCSADSGMDEITPEPNGDYPALKTLAVHPVGVAIQAGHLSNTERTTVIKKVFNSITAEWEMKMQPISTGPGSYNWTGADALVDFAEANGMQVHGHTLVWHQTTPSWMENFGGDDEAFEAAVKEYITTVIQRYKGRVVSWDVINEAFDDERGALRNSVFRRRMGDDYIARLFRYAREADPDLLLFYNDYGLTWSLPKRRAVARMLDDFQERGIPIDGVGLQMHMAYDGPPLEEITETIDEVAKRGLKLHLSELDVRINTDGSLESWDASRGNIQKERVKEVVAAFNRIPEEQRFAITMWGLRDPDTWLIDFYDQPEWPLLFDARLLPKPAYYGFAEALQEAQ